jgi:putative ABC transport system permease protein
VTLTGMGAAVSVGFGLLVFASVLASLAIPRESLGLRTGALQRVIDASRPSDRTVMGAAAETSLKSVTGQVKATDLAKIGALLAARLTTDGLRVASEPPPWTGLTTGYVAVSGIAQGHRYGQPQFEMAYRTALASYSHIVAGRLPVSGSAPGKRPTVQAAVTTATAARFGLRVGSRLNVGPMRLVITGIVRPTEQDTAFWDQDLIAARPSLTPAPAPERPYWVGALFVGPGALPVIEAWLGTNEMQVTWVYGASLGQLTAGQASGLETGVSSLVSDGATLTNPGNGSPVTLTVTSQIPTILSPFIAGEDAVAPVLELLYVSLAVLGAVVVLLGARLVAQRRAAEFTLMRARGAALYQLGWLVLRANVIIAAVAGTAAALLATALTPHDYDPISWWLAGITLVVTLVGPVLISVVPQRVATPATGRPVRQESRRRTAARRIVIETALVAVAIGGLVALRSQGLSSGNSGLYTSAAPALVAIPVAVIVLRCYPLIARALAQVAGQSRGVVAFVGLARATRTPPGAALPAFALVLVLAVVAFSAMISSSVTRGQAAASWRQVGADAVIVAPSGEAITAALQRQVASVPGVAVTATGVVYGASLAPSETEIEAVFVNPARYAAVADRGPGAPFPLAALSGNAARRRAAGTSSQPGGAVVPALATTAAAEATGAGHAQLDLGTQTITIVVTGRIGGVPGTVGNTVAVMPLRALGPNPAQPSLMLVGGSGLNAARLTRAVTRALPDASVTLRSTVLAAISAAPVPRAARAAIAQGMAAAAGFGVLILMLSLLLGAYTRDMTLARLATMGLRRWQAQLLLAAETLPQVVAAAIGGAACAWLLVPLIGPSIDLTGFAGAGPSIVITPGTSSLAASIAGLMLLALLALASQAVITYHRGSARALRIAD